MALCYGHVGDHDAEEEAERIGADIASLLGDTS